jgi:hypothetical protein
MFAYFVRSSVLNRGDGEMPPSYLFHRLVAKSNLPQLSIQLVDLIDEKVSRRPGA